MAFSEKAEKVVDLALELNRIKVRAKGRWLPVRTEDLKEALDIFEHAEGMVKAGEELGYEAQKKVAEEEKEPWRVMAARLPWQYIVDHLDEPDLQDQQDAAEWFRDIFEPVTASSARDGREL